MSERCYGNNSQAAANGLEETPTAANEIEESPTAANGIADQPTATQDRDTHSPWQSVCDNAEGVGLCVAEGGVCVRGDSLVSSIQEGSVCESDRGVCERDSGVCESVCARVGLSDCSDEILLCILRHIPPQDLLLRVSLVCRRLHALSRDKSLLTHISLAGQYTVGDESAKSILQSIKGAVTSLDLAGCYWLSGPVVGGTSRCSALLRVVDLSGCRLPIGRLGRLLAGAGQLKELSLDIARGFDLQALSVDARRTLCGLSALRQTLLVPSYGVLPLCPALSRLELHLEVGVSCEGVELAVGQSSVPHYQDLSCFSARLGPGPANRTLLALLLAPLSIRRIARLERLLISAPGAFPPRPPALSDLLESLGEGLARHRAAPLDTRGRGGGTNSTALQLPGTWLDDAALGRVLSQGCPAYLNLARGGPTPCLPDYDLRPLRSLNLTGCCGSQLRADWLAAVVESCPLLEHLNLSGMHYHHQGNATTVAKETQTHPLGLLARLSQLRSLALAVCVLAEVDLHTPPNSHTASRPAPPTPPPHAAPLLLQGLRKAPRVGMVTYRPPSEDKACERAAAGEKGEESSSGGVISSLRMMLVGCTRLNQLELIGAEFCSATPRYEAANRAQAPACTWAGHVGEVAIATLAYRPSLSALTLAGWAGLTRGGLGPPLVELTQRCHQLTSLSLATLTHNHTHTPTHRQALIQALPHCKRLRDLRVEQAFLELNEPLWEALAACVCLERVCVVSRKGSFGNAVHIKSMMQHCKRLFMMHLFTGDTLTACRNLQKSLTESFSCTRPALSVCVFPLLHEDLHEAVRHIPLTLLDDITLFRSRVAP